MAKINITTLGCPKNTVDSEHLTGTFISEGFNVVDNPHDADILLVNTCGFIKDAKEESIEEILTLSEFRKQGKKLVVFGCLAKRYKDELIREIPEIDGLWGVGEEDKIVEYCKKVSSKQYAVCRDEKEPASHSLLTAKNSYAYLKISEGCDKKCTFCVIPSIRGRHRSFLPETILKEAEGHVRSGVRELILVAQDITEYGRELKGYDLASLLNDIASINGNFRIRLLYLYPSGINDRLLDVIANERKVQRYFDIPLQHSEDRILRLMGRNTTKADHLRLINDIRSGIPEAVLRTSFIVGFPGETEKDFRGLLSFIEEVRFDRLGVFKYSKEEGSPAANLKGHISEKIKQRRLDEIMQRQAEISLKKNNELIGKTYEAIIDEVEGDVAIARLYSHAPEIDGFVEIASLEYITIGDIIKVKITGASEYDLKGIPYQPKKK
ncbi:MAG: 30S ribosomal protein S12 methylthiotransferase RimO [Nitrospirae bacterium]|nr:30S ribosomal protein S12 methylthiotransferase RimO [Nitrospirota bacterium]